LQPGVPPTQPAPSSNTLPATPAENPPPPPPLVSSPPPRGTCFQLDSYADVVRMAPLATVPEGQYRPSTSHVESVFLGTPLQLIGPN
ncbi:hypothetical protein J6590_105056, partial [Homalodisca vitripennis]